MTIIGITGSFGSGKTTVSRMFGDLGAYVIDADNVCHQLIKNKGGVYSKIKRSFGEGLLKKDKSIDRKILAEIVFNNKAKLRLLNRLVHPEAIRRINKIIKAKKREKIIVVDAALLIESGFYKKMDRVLLVKASRDKQVSRIRRFKGMSDIQALQRIRMQARERKKISLADFVIDNSGSKKETLSQVKKIWEQLGEGLCQ